MASTPSSARSVTDVDRFVGGRIRFFRTQANMTMAELARQLGIAHQQLQKYEVGTNRISAGTLSEVSKALGLPVQMFFDQGETDQGEHIVVQLEQARKVIRKVRDAVEGYSDDQA